MVELSQRSFHQKVKGVSNLMLNPPSLHKNVINFVIVKEREKHYHILPRVLDCTEQCCIEVAIIFCTAVISPIYNWEDVFNIGHFWEHVHGSVVCCPIDIWDDVVEDIGDVSEVKVDIFMQVLYSRSHTQRQQTKNYHKQNQIEPDWSAMKVAFCW